MPPWQILVRMFQATFPSNPYQENPDGEMPAHMVGREGNLPIRTQIQSLRVLGILDEVPESASCWPLLVLLCPLLCLLWAALTRLTSFS
jgi:hypothetical protein